MYYRRTLTSAQINRELLSTVLTTPLWWVVLASLMAIALAGVVSAVGFMFNQGLGVTGLRQPVFWGFFITNFVFWVGISHAGVMISAILRLSQAEWRRPMVRAAETMTVFASGSSATPRGCLSTPGSPTFQRGGTSPLSNMLHTPT